MTTHICKSLISVCLKNSPHLHLNRISLLFFSSSPKTPISVSDYLLHTHKFSPETASKVSSIVPYLITPKQTDSTLAFLGENGFSKTHLEKVIKSYPKILSANLERAIKPKINFFRDLGFSSREVVEIVSSNPGILHRRVDNRVGPSILALKSLLGSNMEVCRLLKLCGWFLNCNLEKTMIPNIEFLRSCGISLSQITKGFFTGPRFFLLPPASIREYVKRVDDMGFDRNSKMFLYAIRALSSMSVVYWELKLGVFKSVGFSDADILSVFRRAPVVFTKSERKIRAVTQFLLSSGKFDISYLVDYPGLLNFSVEKRLKPRLRVMEVLERKNLLLKKPVFASTCVISDEKFLEKYVLPYTDEVGGLFEVRKGLLTAER